MKKRKAKPRCAEQQNPEPAVQSARWHEEVADRISSIVKWLYPVFGADGFRNIMRNSLCEEEWNFSRLPSLKTATDSLGSDYELEAAFDYEYSREIAPANLMAQDRLLVAQGDLKPEEFDARWQIRPTACMNGFTPRFSELSPPEKTAGTRGDYVSDLLNCVFPTPWLLAPEIYRLRETFSRYRNPVVNITTNHKRQGRFPRTQHHLEICWDEGIGAVEKALLRWVRSIKPAQLQHRRGRPVVKDRLAQLAAWRIHRAGFRFREYRDILAEAGVPRDNDLVRSYGEASQYRRAFEAAEREIHRRREEFSTFRDCVESCGGFPAAISVLKEIVNTLDVEAAGKPPPTLADLLCPVKYDDGNPIRGFRVAPPIP